MFGQNSFAKVLLLMRQVKRSTLVKSSNRSPGIFIILAKLSNILKIPDFQTKTFDVWNKY